MPETPGSSLNDFRTASRSDFGLRSPCLANSIMRLAISKAVGWVRSRTPIVCNMSSNVAVRDVTSSGLKTPSRNSGCIGNPPTPQSAAAVTRYHTQPSASLTWDTMSDPWPFSTAQSHVARVERKAKPGTAIAQPRISRSLSSGGASRRPGGSIRATGPAGLSGDHGLQSFNPFICRHS